MEDLEGEVNRLCLQIQTPDEWWAMQDLGKVTRKQFYKERYPGLYEKQVNDLLMHNTFTVQKWKELTRRIALYPVGTCPRFMAKEQNLSLSTIYKYYQQVYKMKPSAFAMQVLHWEIDRLREENNELRNTLQCNQTRSS
jgi:hypothetical protein